MDFTLLLVLQVLSWLPISALFTVEAERRSYAAEFRHDVTMTCRFQPVPSSWGSGGTGDPNTDLSVIWHRVRPAPSLEVYRWELGVEKLATQDTGYRGRVRLLTEDLQRGWAKLQVSQLRVNDSGTYQCLLQMGGVDYKQITLSVKAPYKDVNKSIQKPPGGDEVELTCQSQGFPLSTVTWRSGDQQDVHPHSSAVTTTPCQLLQVTSQIRVRSSHRNNYTCSYADGGASATFGIPDEIPVIVERSQVGIISLVTVMALAVVAVAVVIVHLRRRGSRGGGTPNTMIL